MHGISAWLLASMLVSQTPNNLTFSAGTLEGWEGTGFAHVAPNTKRGGIRLEEGAWSKDEASPSKKGMIRNAFVVPYGTTKIVFKAYAEVEGDAVPDRRLEVVLGTQGNSVVPRTVKIGPDWVAAPRLLPPNVGQPRLYSWDVASYQGRVVQIVLVDEDDRPGHYVYAGAFELARGEQSQDEEFTQFMLDLQTRHELPTVARFDGQRFSSISNASTSFTMERMKNCEIFYDHFLNHFKAKGFNVFPPPMRLMLAVFRDQIGFDAYMGTKMPAGVTGIYDPKTNRLVLYDYSQNRLIQEAKKQMRPNDTLKRKFREFTDEANMSTTMHECAHQISFNCGLLNRAGDRPCWVVEGLATYCETTEQGDWTALGSPNPMRIGTLIRAKNKLIPLSQLIASDDWMRTDQVLAGYAQSWALFHLLITERPTKLQEYLNLIYGRRTGDYRVQDFVQAFGDIRLLETRYNQHLREMMEKHAPTKLR